MLGVTSRLGHCKEPFRDCGQLPLNPSPPSDLKVGRVSIQNIVDSDIKPIIWRVPTRKDQRKAVSDIACDEDAVTHYDLRIRWWLRGSRYNYGVRPACVSAAVTGIK